MSRKRLILRYNLFEVIVLKTYVERIRDLREDNDLKQKAIAELLGTTQQVYSRYENGTNEIPLHHLITLARYYNVSLDYIAGETDIKERYRADN